MFAVERLDASFSHAAVSGILAVFAKCPQDGVSGLNGEICKAAVTEFLVHSVNPVSTASLVLKFVDTNKKCSFSLAAILKTDATRMFTGCLEDILYCHFLRPGKAVVLFLEMISKINDELDRSWLCSRIFLPLGMFGARVKEEQGDKERQGMEQVIPAC